MFKQDHIISYTVLIWREEGRISYKLDERKQLVNIPINEIKHFCRSWNKNCRINNINVYVFHRTNNCKFLKINLVYSLIKQNSAKSDIKITVLSITKF